METYNRQENEKDDTHKIEIGCFAVASLRQSFEIMRVKLCFEC
ncbi:hypothetical protein LX64_01899 [Chitinophaga skermanii]|uniref:Uncharacterized protein n=1 Tax=Chitinophaga skermanii TaxID=331697 RepID=A0A327QSV2_9BACT|nr:hypothetical protein LX64_01899 [Chitinophaga skermanii]